MSSKKRQPILLVDDDQAFRKIYGDLLVEEGYELVQAADRDEARQAFARRPFAAVLLDLMLPPDGRVEDGLLQLSELLSTRPEAKVIVVSGAGDVHHMLRAVRSGAYDFLTKPVDPDVLLIVVQRAVARHLLDQQVHRLQESLAARQPEGTMIGQSPAFLKALRLAEQVAPSELPVLITGETGTGKELMARAVHQRSRCADGPFMAVNCGALPETLLESTLFGHVKGAFTGAVSGRAGLFAEATGGTLFLDEIGDMPASLQVKLLRTLESGEILPVGADRPRQVEVRLVSATNRDLAAMLEDGEFREDLYWRVRGAEVALPPLRRRPSDIPLLAEYFLGHCASLAVDGQPKTLSSGAQQMMLEHGWPGNLRELRFEMQRATVLARRRPQIDPGDLSMDNNRARAQQEPTTLHQRVEALERREIEAALARTHGNRTHAARELGLSRQGLLKKMARYEIGL